MKIKIGVTSKIVKLIIASRIILFSLILYLVIPITNHSCSNSNHSRLFKQWKSDKLGCDGIRIQIFYNEFHVLDSLLKSKDEGYVIDNLGEPNTVYRDEELIVFRYYAEPGIQCIDPSDEFVDSHSIYIEIKDGIVSKFYSVFH